MKTLDEEDRQEETEDRPDTDGSSTPEDSERAHKRSTQKDSGSSAGVAQTTGNKRKLDADEQDRPETEETGNVRGEHRREDSEDDVDNPQELEERVDDEKLEDGEDDRPRKKSKVAGDA